MTAPVSMSPSGLPLWLDWSLRLALATLIGAMIGWNRERTGKAAGLRTHMLVSLGSALFILMPLAVYPEHSIDALSRTIQGVATGVGFLGAGEIVHQSLPTSGKAKVKGLTSAAAIWVTAALGTTAACGVWQLSLVGTVITMLTLTVVRRVGQLAQSSRDDEG
ncbi:MAG TPA: MgtC/SapB family protein [Microcoleaceae cyanobacterium]